jgi:hypothetical protein
MWGNQYDRLYGIKTRYDPNGIFFVTPGVGADDFSFEDGKLCRTTDSLQASAMAKGRRPKGNRNPRPAGNVLGKAPESDNRNFRTGGASAYKEFPKSQEDADKEL